MMKHRIAAFTLALILCATALLISPHLVFHADPEHRHTACLVCEILEQIKDSFVCLIVCITGVGLLSVKGRCFLHAPMENQLVPDWTPVRLKVKLLD